MPDITDAWLRHLGFVDLRGRWCFELPDRTSLLVERALFGGWNAYLTKGGIVMKIPRTLRHRYNIVTLIPALGGELHHLVEV